MHEWKQRFDERDDLILIRSKFSKSRWYDMSDWYKKIKKFERVTGLLVQEIKVILRHVSYLRKKGYDKQADGLKNLCERPEMSFFVLLITFWGHLLSFTCSISDCGSVCELIRRARVVLLHAKFIRHRGRVSRY
jgi:hypothetical protein